MSIVAKKIMMGSGAVGDPVDDQFNRVSFLSHFEGSNNGVNNAFDDGSASNHTITANGNVTQGSFNPYGTNWAVDFSKDANPRLSCGSSSDFTFGTGDFTVEFFVFFYSLTSYQTPMSAGYSNDSGGMFIQTGNGDGKFQFRSGGSSLVSETTSDAEANKWYHIAFSRQSGTLRVYRNGVQTGTASNSTNLNRTGNILIGSDQDFNIDGLLSNFRLVKGTSLYNSNFTPPASALTAVTNTKLLTLQSNRFVDNSASGHTVTPNTGKEAVSAFGPFLTSTVYDPAVNGASAYVDGSGDYLNCTVNSDFSFGTADFSIEYYTYRTGADGAIFGAHLGGQADGYYSYTSPPRLEVFSNGGGGGGINSNENTPKNSWFHVVISRQSGRLRIFIDGVLKNSTTTAYTINNDSRMFVVGGVTNGAGPYNGYITGFRVVNGSCAAAYQTSSTTNGAVIFTPPTAPLTAVTNTKLLLNMADGQAIDSAAQHNLTLYGNAKISTGQAKFGNTSLYLDGSDDYLVVNNHQAYGTGPFTIEMFFRLDSVSGSRCLYDDRPDGASGDYISLIIASGAVNFYVGTTLKVNAGSISANTFYHIALCRSGTDTKLFLDGTQIGSTFSSDTTNYLNTGILRVGTNRSYSNDLAGYIDDFRTSHMARYTSNFSPATEPFADKGQ
ncbi:LamG domain-containing protein [Paracoccaceae bacterium]|nr:LamG domain-containing protein [Paracoccaceae bacterium]